MDSIPPLSIYSQDIKMPPRKKPEKVTLSVWKGKFYEGMNADEAKKNDTYSSWTERSFKDIDDDGDGVLSKKEILQEMIVEANRMLMPEPKSFQDMHEGLEKRRLAKREAYYNNIEINDSFYKFW